MPLLDNRPPKPPRSALAQWHRHMTTDVSRNWADVILVFCYLITGLLDSASISVWGSFVSMQTGTYLPTYLAFLCSRAAGGLNPCLRCSQTN